MLTKTNERTLSQWIAELKAKASPQNWAWNKLQELTGYDGDFTAYDHGEAPKGHN